MPSNSTAQKIEALLAAATKLMDEVPGETKVATMAGAGKCLAGYAEMDDTELKWNLDHYGVSGNVTDDLRAGLLLAAKLLTNLDLEVDL